MGREEVHGAGGFAHAVKVATALDSMYVIINIGQKIMG